MKPVAICGCFVPSVPASSKRLPLFLFFLCLKFELFRFKQTIGNNSAFRSPGMADVNEQVDQEIQDAPGVWDCMKQCLYLEFRSINRYINVALNRCELVQMSLKYRQVDPCNHSR